MSIYLKTIMKLTWLTNLCFCLRLECPFDTAVQLAAYNLQGKQFSCWLLGVSIILLVCVKEFQNRVMCKKRNGMFLCKFVSKSNSDVYLF